MNDIVVANANKRDGFNIVLGVEETNLLLGFYSEYTKDMLAGEFSTKEQSVLEKHNLSFLGFFLEASRRGLNLTRLFPKRFFYNWFYTSQGVGKTANVASVVNNARIFSELYSAHTAFMNKSHRDCILFQTHPFCPHLRKIYTSYCDQVRHMPVSKFLPNIHKISEELEMKADWFQTRLTQPAHKVSRIICASDYVKFSLFSEGIAENLISVIPYGVDAERFRFCTKPIIGNSKIKLLFVGQPAERKGLHWLLNYWGEFEDRFELHLVGFNANRQLISGARDRSIFIHGRLSNTKLVDMYQYCDLFLLPSVSEGFGLVLLQALACGTPILASNYSGAPDILKRADVGMTFEAFNINSLRNTLNYISATPQVLKNWTQNTAEIPELFSWQAFRNGIKDVINDC